VVVALTEDDEVHVVGREQADAAFARVHVLECLGAVSAQ